MEGRLPCGDNVVLASPVWWSNLTYPLIKVQHSIGSPIPSVIITAVVVALGSPLSSDLFISLARDSPRFMACSGISMFENDRFPGFSYKYTIKVSQFLYCCCFYCCCCCCFCNRMRVWVGVPESKLSAITLLELCDFSATSSTCKSQFHHFQISLSPLITS